MIPAKRLSAAVLAALLFATSIAMCGCDAGGGDKKGKNGKVPGDGKWYSVHKATVGGQYADAPDVEYFSTKYVGTADGLAIFHVEVQKSVPKGQDPMTADYNELQKSFFEFYGKDGSMVDSIDLRQKIDESGIFELDPKDYSELIKTIRTDADKNKTDEQVLKDNGVAVSWMANEDFRIRDNALCFSLQVITPAKNGASWEQKTMNVSYDVKAGEFKNLGEAKSREQVYVQNAYDFEDYSVTICQSYTSSNQYIFEVKLPDGKEARYKLDSM